MKGADILHNFPVHMTHFIGRQEDTQKVADHLIDPECRLLTIAGPGGVGKTRLAVEVASSLTQYFPEGIYFTSLESINSPALLQDVLSTTFELPVLVQGDSDGDLLLRTLARYHSLLLLDNFEHLIPDCLDLIETLLAHAPRITIMVTSREILRMYGEWIYPIVGMKTGDLMEAETLFADCAGRTDPDFSLKNNLEDVRRICELVEGIPLAIELVSSWLPILTCAEIAAHIQQGYEFIATDLRGVPERHRSMESVFDHSWNLLSDKERDVFQKLSIFRKGFTVEAARQVADAELADLKSLIYKSLVRVEDNQRYTIHEMLRHYAERKHAAADQAAKMRKRHSVYYADFLSNFCQEQAEIGDTTQIFPILEAELDNIWQAWEYALEQNDFSLIGKMLRALSIFYFARGSQAFYFNQMNRLVDRIQALPSTTDNQLALARVFAHLLPFQTAVDPVKALKMYEKAMTLLENNGVTTSEEAGLLENFIGEYYQGLGEHEKSLIHFQKAVSILQNLQKVPPIVWMPLAQVGNAHRYLGHYNEAIKWLKTAIEFVNGVQFSFCEAHCICLLGLIYIELDDIETAVRHIRRSLTDLKRVPLPIRTPIAWNLQGIGTLLAVAGRYAEALECYMILSEWHFGYTIVQRDVCNLVSQMDVDPAEKEYARAKAQRWVTNEATRTAPFGLKLSLTDYLLGQLGSLIAVPKSVTLTVREETILCYVVEGLSNQEIADKMFVTEGTIKRHLHNIYHKLEVRNRVAAVQVAGKLGLCDDVNSA